jgi:serine-type D-Ala-D-Ala carboxypeptidase
MSSAAGACGQLTEDLMATSSMQYACAVLVGAALATSCAHGQRGGRDALRRELADSLSAVLARGHVERAYPGAYAVIGDRIGILAEGGVGQIDWRPGAPAPDRRTLWDLASLTKVVGTTTAIAQLVERGQLDLDAPVQRYLPDWAGSGTHRVTVRHLLTHTSGLPSFRPYDRQTQNPDSLERLLFLTTLERAPGDSMVYSDIGAFVLGEIVERVSGLSLDRYLAANVFGPLGMRNTMFNPPDTSWHRVAPTEIDSLRGGLVIGKVHDERAYYAGGVAAHAGLFSTAEDLARFATMLLHGGAIDTVRVLRAETLGRFTAFADSGRHNRALGWQKAPAAWSGSQLSSKAFGHTGFTGTSILIDPVLDVYVILLSNRVNPTRNNPRIGGVRRQLADAVAATIRTSRSSASNFGNP